MKDLNQLRKEIDKTDKQLLKLLSKRIKLVKEVGIWKKANNFPIIDKKREAAILKEKSLAGQKLGLSPDFINKIWKLFFKQAYLEEE